MSHLAPPSGVDVSVVIVSWNAKDYLRVCLRSIDEQTRNLALEVFVIDNASADGSAQMVRDEFPHVRLIANADNRGFAAANNQGMREATGRYVLLLNPDTVILENAIEKTVQFAEDHPKAGVVGCQVWETPETIQRTCFRFPGPLNLLLSDLGLESALPHSAFFARRRYGAWGRDTEKLVDVVSGMYMLVRRDAIEQVGLMDEAYFVYAEEADWCYRFWKAGWECVFTPIAKILHTEGGSKSTSKAAIRMYVQKQKSLQIFHRKNLGWGAWFLCKWVYAITLFVRLAARSARRLLTRGGGEDLKLAMTRAALKYHLFGVDPNRNPMPTATLDTSTSAAASPGSPAPDTSTRRSMVTCEAARSLDEAHLSEAEWDAFVESVGGWIYQSWNWTRVWLGHYLGDRDARIFVFRAGDRIVGIAPVIIDSVRVGPITVRVAKPVMADFTLALCDPPVVPDYADEIFRKLIDRLFVSERCDVYATGPLTERFGTLERMKIAASSIEGVRSAESTIAPHTTFALSETWDGYLASLAERKLGHRGIRRAINVLERNFRVEADAVTDPEALRDEIEHFLRMHGEQWIREGKLGHFNDWPEASEFARELTLLEGARGRTRLYRILADGNVVSYHLAFRFGDIVHGRIPARVADPEWDKYSLGRVGLAKSIESAIAEGARLVEAGRGHYEYKINMGADETLLRSALFVRPGMLSRLKAGALHRWSAAVHLCYYRIWYQRIAPRLPFRRSGLWGVWIRTRL